MLAGRADQLLRGYARVPYRHVAFTVGELDPARYAFMRAIAETSNISDHGGEACADVLLGFLLGELRASR